MSPARSALALVVALGLLGGCATQQQAASLLNPPDEEQQRPATAQAAEQEVDLISMSHAIADAMVAELRKNHPSFRRRKPILVTTFVDLSNLDNSSELGMLMADQVASRLTQHGYTIVEARLRENLSVRPNQGEFILSRDIDKLSQEHRANAVVVGNYTRGRNAIYLTTKIIQVKDKQVLSSVNAKIPMGENTRDLLIDTDCCSSLSVVDQ